MMATERGGVSKKFRNNETATVVSLMKQLARLQAVDDEALHN